MGSEEAGSGGCEYKSNPSGANWMIDARGKLERESSGSTGP